MSYRKPRVFSVFLYKKNLDLKVETSSGATEGLIAITVTVINWDIMN